MNKRIKDETSDDFPCKCRALTKTGKRCSRNARNIVQVSDRESWIEALKTGWPCMVRDMKTPVWRGRGLCEQHCRQWDRRDPKIGFHMVDEMYAHPELDKEYEEAVAIGDTKNGGVERKRQQNEKSISSGIQG